MNRLQDMLGRMGTREPPQHYNTVPLGMAAKMRRADIRRSTGHAKARDNSDVQGGGASLLALFGVDVDESKGRGSGAETKETLAA